MGETFRTSRNVMTPHPPEAYPGLTVVVPGPGWTVAVICLQDGESFEARGGERVYSYETASGAQADGFELRPGDRATLAASGLPNGFSEWHVERAWT